MLWRIDLQIDRYSANLAAVQMSDGDGHPRLSGGAATILEPRQTIIGICQSRCKRLR